MRIETISKEGLEKIEKRELRSLRFRFRQLWDKHFDDNEEVIVGSLDRVSFLKQYLFLVEEMKSRGVAIPTTNIDRALFSKRMEDHKEPAEDGISKEIVIVPFSKKMKEGIVCGIIAEPDSVDLQGDLIDSADEIEKAAYYFMENSRQLKLKHKGGKIATNILENYLAPQDLVIEGRAIKKGSWLMTIRILDQKIIKKIEEGSLTGFSMAGKATAHYVE